MTEIGWRPTEQIAFVREMRAKLPPFNIRTADSGDPLEYHIPLTWSKAAGSRKD